MANDKKVIDADKMVIIEFFDEADVEKMLTKYRSGKWSDVSVDCNGDIILWED